MPWQSVRSSARGRKHFVRLQHEVAIPLPIARLTPTLTADPEHWFPRGVGIHVAGIPVHKRVDVEFGAVVKTATWAVVEFSWRATFAEKLFPTMRGSVTLTANGAEATRLVVSGQYEPPLGKLGEGLNESVMHAVAERTVKELAERVARRLEEAGG
ncbi:MAG TPA: hypothetical protein VFB69_06215 [Candidatus Dormibacteraeota bacterium]|nr:hypothetical protein [Candidatus Dormibacteraeota bacterium]